MSKDCQGRSIRRCERRPVDGRPASSFNMQPAHGSPEERASGVRGSPGPAAACRFSAPTAICCSKGRQRHHRRLRPQQDPRHREGSGDGRTAVPGQRVRLQAAVRRYRLLRDRHTCRTSNWSTFEGADRALHRRRYRGRRRRVSARRRLCHRLCRDDGSFDKIGSPAATARRWPRNGARAARLSRARSMGCSNLFTITGPGSPRCWPA